MSKVFITQIALSASDDYPDQYLDDKGRVWEQRAIFKTVQDKHSTRSEKVFDHYEWKIFDLPEELDS